MKSADLEIKKELVRVTYALKATLKNCIETVSKTYFKYMYSNPALSDLAKSIISGLKSELREVENELGLKQHTTYQGILIRYP